MHRFGNGVKKPAAKKNVKNVQKIIVAEQGLESVREAVVKLGHPCSIIP